MKSRVVRKIAVVINPKVTWKVGYLAVFSCLILKRSGDCVLFILDEQLDGHLYLSSCRGDFYRDFRFKNIFDHLGLLADEEDLGAFRKILAFDD